MSFFAVTLEKIRSAVAHPGADRLDICTLDGMDFQFVTGRGAFAVGDSVLYFPLDSVLPENVVSALGLTGRLAGADCNRVKTAVLRGEISQGLVSKPELFLSPEQMSLSPAEITGLLGVRKYEPEPTMVQGGQLLPLPTGAVVYDIESASRFTEAADMLADVPCAITEKMEGMNFGVTCDVDGRVFVNQRENTIIPDDEDAHYVWAAAKAHGLIEKVREIRDIVCKTPDLARFAHQNITLYGELCGPKIQKNIYGLPAHRIFAFDIRAEVGFIPAPVFYDITRDLQIETAPVLSYGATLREWLNGVSISVAAGGSSQINADVRREGVVIKPLVEGRWSRGRLIIKQHCPLYLAKSKI